MELNMKDSTPILDYQLSEISNNIQDITSIVREIDLKIQRLNESKAETDNTQPKIAKEPITITEKLADVISRLNGLMDYHNYILGNLNKII